ncbi:FAD-dependent monooxygenase [Bradyrhizobium sp. NP1]|uniref:FAD-dependent monooxygenase n=1 Tax=Bradyrhizobium sp. NP1 TaxID=3049772 RepID=UPI0025A53BBD|nr:FAD-dependent monooxygenase [Bradyrhizobium sp. NP1]WJR80982.1 FAD-dependent monooxygenase [Bradyrhizobium sp. NP1]
MATTHGTTSVIIAGAGPVGLALACELGMRGIACTVVERRDGTISLPRMSAVSARNMEFCRRWGIAEEVRTAVWPESHAMDFVYLDNLRGHEFARNKLPPSAARGLLAFTPEGGCHCPQIYFDPILAKHAASYASVTLRYGMRLDDFEETADGVSSTLTDLATERTEVLAGKYLVGCDGPGGMVREKLAIGLGEMRIVAHSVNIFFRSSALASLHDKGWARFYRLIDASGCWAELISIDGRELWRLTVFDDEAFVRDPEAALVKMAGTPFPYELLSVMPWERRDVVADAYGHGRVLIAGDAAHQCSPTGGLGMHTGIEEAVNLGWKLSALIEGWGGPQLLASYEAERRPIALRNVAVATRIYGQIRNIPGQTIGGESGAALDEWRKNLGAFSISEEEKMTYTYENSPIVQRDDADAGAGSRARPGMRAPHAWLADGRSTLDLFGTDLTLLCFEASPEIESLVQVAREDGVPLRTVAIDDRKAAALYGAAWVLVRPDGHVAWRSSGVFDAKAIMSRCRGL